MRPVRGFTIVELVIVIALLGVLAAVALPRFLDIGDNARQSVLEHLEGKLHSIANLVYAEAVLRSVQNQARNDSDVVIEGMIVELKYGYPEAQVSTAGHADMMDLLELQLSSGLTVDTSVDNRVRIGYDNDNSGCYVQYQEADADAVSPNPYQVALVTTGCN